MILLSRDAVSWLLGITLFAYSIGASTAVAEEDNKALFNEDYLKKSRVMRTRPARIENGPLREENITDKEVLEIEKATLAIVPGAIVNIGGITSKCPCEDGPNCSAQAWIVGNRPKRSIGLLLSKIDGHWKLGPVQEWWLRYYKHEDKYFDLPRWANSDEDKAKWDAWKDEEQRLLDNFPNLQCEDKMDTFLRSIHRP